MNITKLQSYNWIFNTVSYLGIAMVFSDLLFSLSDNFPVDITIVGFSVVLLSYLTKKGISEYFKRKKAFTPISNSNTGTKE